LDSCITWSSCGKPGLKQLFHEIAEITIPLSEELLFHVKMLLVGHIRCDLRVCRIAAPSLLAWFRHAQARSYRLNWNRRLNCWLTRIESRGFRDGGGLYWSRTRLRRLRRGSRFCRRVKSDLIDPIPELITLRWLMTCLRQRV